MHVKQVLCTQQILFVIYLKRYENHFSETNHICLDLISSQKICNLLGFKVQLTKNFLAVYETTSLLEKSKRLDFFCHIVQRPIT